MSDVATTPSPETHEPSDTLPVSIAGLHVYPVKSCGGVEVTEALVVETGLEFDRFWVLVDEAGVHVTQRTQPRLALVSSKFSHGQLVLRAPGMLALHVALDQAEAEKPEMVKVWDDEISAYDMGALARQWFSDYLGIPVRLMRLDPEFKRICDPKWTAGYEGQAAFSDGFSLLVVSQASLDNLNERLAAGGHAAVGWDRFRPNLVLSGLEPHQEDSLDEVDFDTPEGPVRLKILKPCTRCIIPNIDQATALKGTQPSATLIRYRRDPAMGGVITFGMNAIVLEGADRLLRAGQAGRATVRSSAAPAGE